MQILVPIDFTDAQQKSLQKACLIAQRGGASLTLIHIITSHTRSELKKIAKDESYVSEQLSHICDEIHTSQGIECNFIAEEGDLFADLNEIAEDGEYNLMVMASHGAKGFRQQMLGADILKLVKACKIPVIVVHEKQSTNREMSRIVFPYGGQDGFEHNARATADLAEMFNSEVHIYKINRPMEELSAQSIANMEAARELFRTRGIQFREVEEDPSVFSMGYSKQILQYAEKVGAGVIAVMANASKEYAHFADADKERLLSNELGIAVMLTNEHSVN